MPCPHCGENINICPYCAYTQEEEFKRCPKCRKLVRFCASCGSSLSINNTADDDKGFDEAFMRRFRPNMEFGIQTCPKCGQEIGDALFCPFCGCDLTKSNKNADYEVVENVEEYFEQIPQNGIINTITDIFAKLQAIFKEPVENTAEQIDKNKKEEIIKPQNDEHIERDFNNLENKSSGWTLYICFILIAIALFVLYKTYFAG